MEHMTERLIVKNFLCLEDIDIEVKDFLILIGPQAAGKSLCAKLLYFFGTIYEEITLYHMKGALDELSGFCTILSNRFESFFPSPYWSEQDFYIEYQRNQKIFFEVKKEKNQEINIYLNQAIQAAAGEITKSFQNIVNKNNNHEITEKLLSQLSDRYVKVMASKNIFIPAGRSFFSLLQKNIFKFLQTSNNIDPFLLEFGIFYEEIKQTGHDIPAEAQTLIHSILKGDYVYAENMLLTDGRKITLELLSSGQQEALPLALVFVYIISLNLEPYDFTNIYVEEPEAHLFPDAQEQITRLISFLRYSANHKVTFVITTHSPYMLAAFNNLIKAGNIVKQNPGLKDAVCKIIPESMHIDIESFSAYSLKDGRAESIIDEETCLINADAIDGVSENIMEIFNALLDIEPEDGKAAKNV
ncbi:MAG: ATP-binding protein [Treponema sp.]|jgi:ABC-type cobalamin/Fe3+-siderophores transport system ATPase subunit|nr:ATP-binding protein [Treponema sp.]